MDELYNRLNGLKESHQAFILSGLFGLISGEVSHSELIEYVEEKTRFFEGANT